ncbi:unnamed protein product [Heligmosomoides polygyrus]|uniref:Uncharacterized protein n=1 Tax=Heligmosomoides polygyrus TaxID=6339 RepID=A0A183FAZ6_HELPZ|nr:unnamed protein product [Heligmosomoides polygyrus]
MQPHSILVLVLVLVLVLDVVLFYIHPCRPHAATPRRITISKLQEKLNILQPPAYALLPDSMKTFYKQITSNQVATMAGYHSFYTWNQRLTAISLRKHCIGIYTEKGAPLLQVKSVPMIPGSNPAVLAT